MPISKVNFGGTTLIDLTSDTVTADKLISGYTAHNAAGAIITGTNTGPKPEQSKSFTPTAAGGTVYPDSGKVLSSVSIASVPTESKTITENGTYTPTSGKFFNSVTVSMAYNVYRTGSGAPSSSLGSNGDLYFDLG